LLWTLVVMSSIACIVVSAWIHAMTQKLYWTARRLEVCEANSIRHEKELNSLYELLKSIAVEKLPERFYKTELRVEEIERKIQQSIDFELAEVDRLSKNLSQRAQMLGTASKPALKEPDNAEEESDDDCDCGKCRSCIRRRNKRQRTS